MRRYFCLFVAGLIGCGLLASPASAAETKAMFDGKSLEGWDFFLQDSDAKMEDVWSVRDGMIICKGKPMGFLATKEKFKDFKLVVEWRWAPGTKQDSRPNSGVLLRITGEKKMLPKCVEAQLMSGSAGDIWAFEGFKVQGDEGRFREIPNRQMCGLSKIEGAEKELGEWNKYEITLVGDKLTLVVNGKKVNECTGCDEVAGQIGLQSEGGPIHFRKVEVTPMGD